LSAYRRIAELLATDRKTTNARQGIETRFHPGNTTARPPVDSCRKTTNARQGIETRTQRSSGRIPRCSPGCVEKPRMPVRALRQNHRVVTNECSHAGVERPRMPVRALRPVGGVAGVVGVGVIEKPRMPGRALRLVGMTESAARSDCEFSR
jgi:hypothetical protein